MEFEIIKISWEARKRVDSSTSEIESGAGIYAAYGDHDIYGRDVLVYIGKTVHFDIRTRQHLDGILSKVNNLSLAYGKVSSQKSHSGFDPIGVAEQVLIAALKPAYNRQNIHNLGSETLSRGFLIQNLEERGGLPLEVTNYWWLPDEVKE